jgi:hypothetical protein
VNPDVSPLYDLVAARMNEIGLSRRELIERCGYRNVTKGLRRLDAIWNGALGDETSSKILDALPINLDLDPAVVEAAVNESCCRLEQSARNAETEWEAAWRGAFQPDAYLVGTYTRPTQITIFAITGGHKRWHRIKLDLTKPPVTFAEQARAVTQKTPETMFFGPTTGFIVNYSPNYAIRFGLDGNPIEVFLRAYSGGCGVAASMSGRPIDTAAFSRLLGYKAE